MATYRFRITFEDHDDVSRDIEIRSTQTFDDLHHAIHSSIGFDASKPASFYMSDDNWKKGKEITTRELSEEEAETINSVRKARLCDYIIDPHQKIYYIFDFTTPWTFRIELIKINRDEDVNASYPRCLKATGEAPKQYQTVNIATLPVPEDFDGIAELEDELEAETEEEETDVLGVDVDEIPEGEDKDTFLATTDEEATDGDFETADEDAIDDEAPEKDEF
jgi:hypothetical protein